ncbi:Flp family type IVb pilin [Neobacillus massiliamazoniensis]|uniref:Flp/Fap pilin component n=1 Tax=Neobacillus massiliamazoniensis TaxID=1499688 RepID=A0A0U1NU29_9BACI|nr:Flp family type IVb pilin [Neobacillus massiliamazoniensis]CRK81533.1 Flp/Fap pilin component [Neobacillus massiliamazoniensis]
MLKKIKNLVLKEEGQALTEYGLIIALVAVLLVGSLIALKEQLITVFKNIVDGLKTTTTP